MIKLDLRKIVRSQNEVSRFDWLKYAEKKLSSAGITTARLDCLVILEDTLNKNRTHILAYQESYISPVVLNILNRKIRRRSTHEPLAYIRGKCEFYGREFLINKHVLVPRPESETMIDLLKSLKIKQPFVLADVGSGSGCLGITAKLEFPNITVDMLELNDNAYKVCKKNKQHLGVDNSVIESDLLESTTSQYDVILANLPYVPDGYQINQAAAMEPPIAIFGGLDGLDLYRKLFRQLSSQKHLKYVFTESFPFQHQALIDIADSSGYRLLKSDAFIQVFTV
ncbi:HemK family protein methyltransferase [Candidatus Saccharibacteria bacterium]|nr:HemK family protein methyltransferase [Candidatus Saccharibacteria bacterium]MBI3338386.1 HemK family protein methyltransferase [Candidatus Saccharibacteria bacterium]